MNDAGTNAAITAKEANERAPDEKAESVKAAPPELNPKLTKPGVNDATTEASAAEAKATSSDQGTSPVIATTAELNPNPTKPTANDAVIDATSMVEDSEVMVATVSDSIPTVMATNDDGGTAPELNPKLTKPGENDAATEVLAAEAKATASDQGTSPVIVTAAELNPNPTKPTANDAVIDAALMVEDSEVMVATVSDSIPTVMATNDNGGTVSQGKVSQPPSVDQMVLDLKRKIAEATENKSSDATAEGSVEPAMVSLSALSLMSPSPGPKADEYQPAPQYTPSPGPFPDKNRPRTRSTTSPDPKKKQSPFSAVADESLMHSGRNFDALVGMDSLTKAAFHWTLRIHPKYTQAYLDHAYNIVHVFRKRVIRVLHVIEPKEGGAVQDDEDKKDGKPDPNEKLVEVGSPDSIKTDSPSNENLQTLCSHLCVLARCLCIGFVVRFGWTRVHIGNNT
jgi:hypothetical protein